MQTHKEQELAFLLWIEEWVELIDMHAFIQELKPNKPREKEKRKSGKYCSEKVMFITNRTGNE